MKLNTLTEVNNLFRYHPPTEDQFNRYVELKDRFIELAEYIMQACPASEERDLALRSLHQASMQAVLSISVNEN